MAADDTTRRGILSRTTPVEFGLAATLVAGTWYFAGQMYSLRADVRDIHADVNQSTSVLSVRMGHVEGALTELRDRIKALEMQK
jgi:hypothetical protein